MRPPTSTATGSAEERSDRTVAAPEITLPKGGGAIRGIGESFSTDLVTGTGSMSVPIAVSPGRGDSAPTLSLSYDSGSGNGPFGFGWSVSLANISRRTDQGLPRYDDAADSDPFLLTAADDLVPRLRQDAGAGWVIDQSVRTIDGATYRVRRYRPRVDRQFHRIERWTRDDDPSDVHWRTLSADNVLSVYGLHAESRLFDPDDPTRIFRWLICEQRDDKGNALLFEYKPDDGAGVDPGEAHERNRGSADDPRRRCNRYIKRIRYGNRVPLLDASGRRPALLPAAAIAAADWMFELVFDYGEHDDQAPTPTEQRAWDFRSDPFSSYRSGFEIRTTRLCRRVLMFHHFADEPGVGRDCLVRSTDFSYAQQPDPGSLRQPAHAFLLAVAQTGYRRSGSGYLARSLPPLEFSYSEPQVQDNVQEVDPASLANLPIGFDGEAYRWLDLHGEGVPGILTEQADRWYYTRNRSPLGAATPRPEPAPTARFAALEMVAQRPSLTLADGAQIMDLAGDGEPDLVMLDGPLAGLFEHDGGQSWTPFRPFPSQPNRDFRDPNLRFVDLDGDGRADLLITEDDALVWHPSLAEAGFGPARRVLQALDDELGPRLLFADPAQSIHLADMSGDGLTDLVRIRNGEVCYWPNLGHGRFGPKVTMDSGAAGPGSALPFDDDDQFSQQRIRLADIDGSGSTDIIYLHRDGVRLYFNQSGNRWSAPQTLRAFPRIDDQLQISAIDLLGNGTTCLVWSSSQPADRQRPMRYVDLMGGQKPHLLIAVRNNLGAETRVRYAPSTRFYLQDRDAGRPWLTRLAFPVHVVERVETVDHISHNRFVTRYAYHHGYFDGEEREFRGFGMVEQWDAEQIGALTAAGVLADASNIDIASQVPPVHAKSWFHTGVYIGHARLADAYAGLLGDGRPGEYYREPGLDDDALRRQLLTDTVVPAGLDADEEREACRALKGKLLRREIYALDGSNRQPHPYQVSEQNFNVRLQQPRAGNRHAVFDCHAREAISYHYERNPADPRIQHELTLDIDRYGNVLKQIAVGYGRRQPDPSLPTEHDRVQQGRRLLTFTERQFSHPIDDIATHPDDYRTPAEAQHSVYELTGFAPPTAAFRFSFEQWTADDFAALTAAEEIPYEQPAAAGVAQKRLIERIRTLYRPDDLGHSAGGPLALLPLGELQSLALSGERYRLAFTPGLLARIFVRDGQPLFADPADLFGGGGGDRGGYLSSQQLKADGRFPPTDADGHWWIPDGRSFLSPQRSDSAAQELAFARQHFFQPHRFRDPFDTAAASTESVLRYDRHDLLLLESRDALDNRTTVGERRADGSIDPDRPGNDYRVLRPWRLMDPNGNRTEVAFDALGMVVATALMGKPGQNLGDSLDGVVADLDDAVRLAELADPLADPQGMLGAATTRMVYDFFAYQRSRLQPQPQPAVVHTLQRETHRSDLAPGQRTAIQHSFSYSDGFAREIQTRTPAAAGPLLPGGPTVTPRWIGSGWVVFNNKGKPVRRYEPFFSATHRFEFGLEVGVSPIVFYDPLQRVVATLQPDHSVEKVVFDPWQQTTWDGNDSVLGDPRSDPHISGFTAGYFASLDAAGTGWQSWHAQRIGGALGNDARNAALRAQAHADTPTRTVLDSLGRSVLTIAHNRVDCAGHPDDGIEQHIASRIELDIEGNQRVVRDGVEQGGDPLGRIVMRYACDMLGHRVHQQGMDDGEHWWLDDVVGKTLRRWDSRGHEIRIAYDRLRRPVERSVRGSSSQSDPRTLGQHIVFERIEYGEGRADAELLNLRRRIYRHFDQAGIDTRAVLDAAGVPILAYDFKGNLLGRTRQLLSDATAVADWSQTPAVDSERFSSRIRYDALNRPVQTIAPRSSELRATLNVIQPQFDESNRVRRLDVWLQRDSEPSAVLDPAVEPPAAAGITRIDYDARGQRLRVDYGNGASTRYRYDAQTFRLISLYTRRPADFTTDCDNPLPPPATIAAPEQPPADRTCGVQNLRYSYDPAGNISHIGDQAQQTLFFRNRRVEPSNDFVYDALYRLIQASGREQLAPGGAAIAHAAQDIGRIGLPHPGDGNAVGRYVEHTVYDTAGNIVRMQHRGTDPLQAGWARSFTYDAPSRIEDGSSGTLKRGNRLSRSTLNPDGGSAAQPEPYLHDSHGNMSRMPHLGGVADQPNLHWDYRDRLHSTEPGTGVVHYAYDADGQRVRKVWQKAPGLVEERIYLDGFELFRRHGGPNASVNDPPSFERETLHVMDGQQRVALVETRTLDVAGSDPAPARLIRFQHGNLIGSACLELDDQARIVSYEEYSPYGSSTYQAMRSAGETPKRYRFSGRERDDETGLGYHGARYYASWLGRWTSADPEGLDAGPNLYAYALNNPNILVDTDGRQPAPVVDPQTIQLAATALQRAAAAWGSATVISGGAAAAAPVAGAAAPAAVATPVAGTATGLGIAGGAVVAAQIVAGVAMALAVRLHMQRAGSIARYGNPYGMPARDIAFPTLRAIREHQRSPFPIPEPAPKPNPDKEDRPAPRPGRVYVTYTKFNASTGRTYSGRTSAVIDLNLPWRPQAEAAVRARDANHHIDENDEPDDVGFGPAELDDFAVGYAVNYSDRYRDVAYLAIRGREQQLIDQHGRQKHDELGLSEPFIGGARSDTGSGTQLTENGVRGVAKDNPLGELFHAASNLVFGEELAPFTGHPIQRQGTGTR